MSTSALGRLVASVILDTAEFTVGADKAKYIAAAAASSIDKSFRDVGRSVTNTLTGIAGALAAGFSVAELKSTFDEVAKGAASFVDLAAKAGTTVQFMAGIEPVAKLSGTSLDDVASAAAKLSKGLVNSSDTSIGAGHALAFLGINASDASGHLKDSGTLMEEIALKLATYQDGVAKSTIAMDLFGKSGASMIPFLKDLATYGTQDAEITQKQALLAKQYEQDVARLGIAKSALAKIISAEVLPVADAFVQALLAMTTKTGGVRDKAKELAEDGSIRSFAMMGVNAFALLLNAGDGVVRIFKLVGDEIGYLVARAGNTLGSIGEAVTAFSQGRYRDAWNTLKDASVRDGAIVADHTNQVRQILEKPLAGDAFVAVVEQKLAGIDRQMNVNVETTKKNADGYKALGNAADNAFRSEKAHLEEEIAKLQGAGEYEAYLTKLQTDRFQKLTPKQREWLALKEQEYLGLKFEMETTASYNKLLDELDAFNQAKIDKTRTMVEQLNDQNDRQAKENELIGLTAEARALANTEIEREIALRGIESPLQIKAINDAYDLKAALAAQSQEGESQIKLWGELADKAGTFFSDLVMHGKSAFDNLKNMLKDFAAQLLALFAKQYVLSMIAGVTGSSVIGNAAASVGANTIGGAIFGGAPGTGLLGGTFGGVGSMIGDFSAGLAGEGAGVFATGSAGGIGSSIAMAIGAIPVWGQIALVIGALAIAVGLLGKGGGPKGGGSFMGSFTSGGFGGDVPVPGSDNGRFYTPSDADPQLATIGKGIGKSFYQVLTALGGTSAGMQFGIGYDTDPHGTAQNRVSGIVRDASGNVLFSDINRNIGRDDKQIGPELQLESERMMLAALQSSKLPDYLSHVFDGLTASSATQQQIEDALKQAESLKAIFDVVTRDPLADLAAATEADANKFQTALSKNNTAIKQAISAYDGSAAAAENLKTATLSYYSAQLQLIAGLDQAKAAIDDVFGATFRKIQLAGLDKQGKYNFYQSEAQSLEAQALASTDPETIKALTDKINADINAAFDLLTPEEQKAQGATFISQGQAAQKAIDEHLEAIRKAAVDDMKSVLEQIKTAIGASADAQTAAAATQTKAADTQLTAANTPKQVVLVIPGGSQQVVTFGP